jgi:hypothetical protein
MKSRLIRVGLLVGAVTAFAAVPVAGAANHSVQIGGTLVAPAQISSTELGAGHAASTRLVQIGGDLVKPSQLSSWQSGSGGSSDNGGTSASSSSSFGSGSIALVALAGAMALLAATGLLMRRRLPLSRAT